MNYRDALDLHPQTNAPVARYNYLILSIFTQGCDSHTPFNSSWYIGPGKEVIEASIGGMP